MLVEQEYLPYPRAPGKLAFEFIADRRGMAGHRCRARDNCFVSGFAGVLREGFGIGFLRNKGFLGLDRSCDASLWWILVLGVTLELVLMFGLLEDIIGCCGVVRETGMCFFTLIRKTRI